MLSRSSPRHLDCLHLLSWPAAQLTAFVLCLHATSWMLLAPTMCPSRQPTALQQLLSAIVLLPVPCPGSQMQPWLLLHSLPARRPLRLQRHVLADVLAPCCRLPAGCATQNRRAPGTACGRCKRTWRICMRCPTRSTSPCLVATPTPSRRRTARAATSCLQGTPWPLAGPTPCTGARGNRCRYDAQSLVAHLRLHLLGMHNNPFSWGFPLAGIVGFLSARLVAVSTTTNTGHEWRPH
jgi:hypothetical protein